MGAPGTCVCTLCAYLQCERLSAVACGHRCWCPAGVLVLCLFNVSNPFLHVAKILNQLGLPARVPAFAAFAAIFFVTRVVLVPYSILRVTVWDSW